MSTQIAPVVEASASAPIASLTLEEALAQIGAQEAALAAVRTENSQLRTQLPVPEQAFVPVVTALLRPAGYDANVGTAREGMFVSQQAKLEVSVTRKSGNPVIIRENLAVWRAVMGAAELINAALA